MADGASEQGSGIFPVLSPHATLIMSGVGSERAMKRQLPSHIAPAALTICQPELHRLQALLLAVPALFLLEPFRMQRRADQPRQSPLILAAGCRARSCGHTVTCTAVAPHAGVYRLHISEVGIHKAPPAWLKLEFNVLVSLVRLHGDPTGVFRAHKIMKQRP
jgi:hypothetical protein